MLSGQAGWRFCGWIFEVSSVWIQATKFVKGGNLWIVFCCAASSKTNPVQDYWAESKESRLGLAQEVRMWMFSPDLWHNNDLCTLILCSLILKCKACTISVRLSGPPLDCCPQTTKCPKGLVWTRLESIDFRGLWMRSIPGGLLLQVQPQLVVGSHDFVSSSKLFWAQPMQMFAWQGQQDSEGEEHNEASLLV